jgi:hypothetical protein
MVTTRMVVRAKQVTQAVDKLNFDPVGPRPKSCGNINLIRFPGSGTLVAIVHVHMNGRGVHTL